MKKFLIYVLLIALSLAGVYYGSKTYLAISETGQIVGELEHYEAYKGFDKFNYNLSGKYLYESKDMPGIYEIKEEILIPNPDIDFTDLSFEVIINNKPCYNVYVYERVIFAETELNFVNIYGNDIGIIKLKLEFQYWIDKTVVKVTAPDCPNIKRLNTYLDIYGLEIRIIPAQHESYKVDNSKDLVTISYFDGYNCPHIVTTMNIYENKTVRDAYNLLPELTLPGFEFTGWKSQEGSLTNEKLDRKFNEDDGGYSYTFYPLFKGISGYGIYSNGSLVVSLENLVNKGYLMYINDEEYCLIKNHSAYGQTEKYTGELILPEGIKFICLYNSIDEKLNITSITIPSSVNLIDLNGCCSNMTELNIPKTVTEIDSIKGCSSLKNIYIPKSVTKISSWAFDNLDINIYFEVETKLEGYNFTNTNVHYGYTYEQYLLDIQK